MSLVDENGVSLVVWTLFRADYPSSPGARFSREPLLSLEVKKGSVPSRFEALPFLKIKGVSLGAEGGKAEGLL